MGLGIKMMVGNVEIMVFTLNNSSALNLTLGHIIPGRPRALCCEDPSGRWTPAEPGRAGAKTSLITAVLSPFSATN